MWVACTDGPQVRGTPRWQKQSKMYGARGKTVAHWAKAFFCCGSTTVVRVCFVALRYQKRKMCRTIWGSPSVFDLERSGSCCVSWIAQLHGDFFSCQSHGITILHDNCKRDSTFKYVLDAASSIPVRKHTRTTHTHLNDKTQTSKSFHQEANHTKTKTHMKRLAALTSLRHSTTTIEEKDMGDSKGDRTTT